MRIPNSTQSEKSSPARDVLPAVQYYFGNWKALLVFAIIASVVGLALNWSWLVAVGVAPILLSTLPCLLMCGFGVCMMCRSNKK